MQQQTSIQFRPTVQADLETLFRIQLNKEAIHIAAFTPKDPTDKEAYIEKFTKILKDPSVNMLTIFVEGTIAGSVAKFMLHGRAEITYWIERDLWGKGIATAALRHLLSIEKTRPIMAGVAFDNTGSQRVLEKCGFIRTGKDRGFANARQEEIEEFLYKLE